MEELTPHPPTLCPKCNKPMVHTTYGDVCVDCSQLVHHDVATTNKPAQPSLSVEPIVEPPQMPKQPRQLTTATQEIHHTPPKQVATPTQHAHTQQAITKQDALRYRHRLKARLRRLIVPELPGKLTATELSSPLSETALSQKPFTRGSLSQASASAHQDGVDTSPHHSVTSSKAFVLAETIAETDSSADLNSNTTEAKESSSKRSPALLLGGTIIAILLVALLGFWTTRSGQQGLLSHRTTQQPTKPTTPPAAKITAEALKRDATRKEDLSNLATALEVYKRQQGLYPAGNDISVVYPLQYTTPPFISYINYDPSSDNNTKIKYSYTSDGSSFTIAARLEDPTDPEGQNGYYIVKSK